MSENCLSFRPGQIVEKRRNFKLYLNRILTTWSTNLKSIHKNKFRNLGYTSSGQDIKYLDVGIKKADLLVLPRLPHLKKKTASEKFPVGWHLYNLPETNFYKLVEIKFDNRYKAFCHWESDKDRRKIGYFMVEVFKCLVMNFIEWKWDVENINLSIAQTTYKKVLGTPYSSMVLYLKVRKFF